MLTASCRLIFPCKDKRVYLNLMPHDIMSKCNSGCRCWIHFSLTDSVSLTRNWWNFSSRGDFLIIFLLMLVCQACSSGYLEMKKQNLKRNSSLFNVSTSVKLVKSYQLRGWGASIVWPSISSSRISLKYLSFRQWRISLAWLKHNIVTLLLIGWGWGVVLFKK